MRRLLFPLAAIGCVLLAALLVWLWTSDTLLIRQCRAAEGNWNAEQRVCELSARPVRRVTVSPRD